MDLNRIKYLSKEVDVVNAFMNNEKIVLNDLFEGNPETPTTALQIDKICELLYRIFHSVDLENTSNIESSINDYFNNNEISGFCINFIKMQIKGNPNDQFETKLDFLLSLNPTSIPMSRIKIDYYQAVLYMLLCQQPLDLELINNINGQLKVALSELE